MASQFLWQVFWQRLKALLSYMSLIMGENGAEYNILEEMLLDESEKPKMLPLSLLEKITSDFSRDEIGRGGFAVVYKGKLATGAVAVKKLYDKVILDEKLFHREIQCLMKVRHKNIVRFLGYCADTQGQMANFKGELVMAETRNRLLCFEYVPNGSLHHHITDASCGLEWRKRSQLIRGICNGLDYLHERNILHLDLKPANILLDRNMIPKISDFGLSRCFDESQSKQMTSDLSGSPGYMAPERYQGQITLKQDIYSLGVVITEILTGEKTRSEVDDVLEEWKNRVETSELRQVEACARIALMCMDDNAKNRPDMKQIIKMLDEVGSVDELDETDVNISSLSKDGADGADEKSVEVSSELVDCVRYLYVRFVRVKRRRGWGHNGPIYHADVSLGKHRLRTRATTAAGEWKNQIFTFPAHNLTRGSLEVSIYEEATKKKLDGDAEDEPADDGSLISLGFVSLNLQKVLEGHQPVPPRWYPVHNGEEEVEVNVKLALWVGTQADKAFQEAWHSESGGCLSRHTRSMVYLSPKLWNLRLSVIEVLDLPENAVRDLPSFQQIRDRPTFWDLRVKAQLGHQTLATSRATLRNDRDLRYNNCWNEDLVFVAAEPWSTNLIVSVEARPLGELVGRTIVELPMVPPHVDPPSQWLDLLGIGGDTGAGRLHVRVCLEGGYNVLDDARAEKPPLGTLEVGVRRAIDLLPMKKTGTTDAYVVLRYGRKWARTRTILDRFNPMWNEQFSWDVFDPCTLLTVAVFDNVRCKGKSGDQASDRLIGKFHVGLSTLDTNRVYTDAYALTAVTPACIRKMGELELAIRFTCSSWLRLMRAYGSPVLPRMHYVKPPSTRLQHNLRFQGKRIVSEHLERSEPPLAREVVESMLDTENHMWSLRRTKANLYRVLRCLSHVTAVIKWARRVRTWADPTSTVLIHALLVVVVLYPEATLYIASLCLLLALFLGYHVRQHGPVATDQGHSQWVHPDQGHSQWVHTDELDEEFDTFPTSRQPDLVRMRYDRLRSIAARVQMWLDIVAALVERVEGLLSWRDPRATMLFVAACLLAALLLYAVPFKLLVLGTGFYYLRHPRLRGDTPSACFNFFFRLPSCSPTPFSSHSIWEFDDTLDSPVLWTGKMNRKTTTGIRERREYKLF